MQLKCQYNAHFITVYKHVHTYIHIVENHVCNLHMQCVRGTAQLCLCVRVSVCQHTRQAGCEGTLALPQ